jgi:hypothetical protein
VVLTDEQLLLVVEPLLANLREVVDSSNLNPQTKADAMADINPAADQTRATHPNQGVIRAALDRAKLAAPTILLGTALYQDSGSLMHGLGH